MTGVDDTLIIQEKFHPPLRSIMYLYRISDWKAFHMHATTAAMNISLPHGVLQEGPALSKQTGIISIVYYSVGSTVGAG